MNFNELYKKINAIDKGLNECGEPMGAMMQSAQTPPPSHPSMSVSLNAQGMDNIESLMKLFTKVNPDMMPKGQDTPLPKMTSPALRIGAAPNLPALDDSEDDEGKPPRPPMVSVDDAKEEIEDEFRANTTPEPVYKDASASVPNGNDMHKQKSMYRAAQLGDNPRATEDLLNKVRESLAAELEQYKNS